MVEMFMGYGTIKNGVLTSLQSGHFPQVQVGLDASKPTANIGDFYIATDTGKQYICYVASVWSLYSSFSYEEYSNHLGTVDNIMNIATAGNGTATTNSVNHRMDLSTGISAIGLQKYHSLVGITPATQEFECDFLLQNIVTGVGGSRRSYVGLMADPSQGALSDGVYIYQDIDIADDWIAFTRGNLEQSSAGITTPANGDLITIKGMKNIVQFIINGVVTRTVTTINLTGVTCYPVVVVNAGDANVSTARQISCDYISWKVFK